MSNYRIILAGQLIFNNQRSFEMALAQYNQRVEIHFKYDVFLRSENIFDADQQCLNIPRHVEPEITERTWKNTISALETVCEYSIAGSLSAWKLENSKIVEFREIEPNGDKSAIQSFLLGRKLVGKGEDKAAKEALDLAIQKCERHAKAYERRGYVNFRLGNFKDALYDFNKSININAHGEEAHFGRAFVNIRFKDYISAIKDFDTTLKNSIPHQPIFWKAKRIKGECHLILGEYKNAILALEPLSKRTFLNEDNNFGWQRKVWFNLGQAYLGDQNFKEATIALEKAKALPQGKDILTIEDIEGLLKAAKEGKTPPNYLNPVLGSIKTGAPMFP
ncbi:MAG: hypothetical protein EBS35_05215 [Bacteroidetes bacterium]|nr:hypothetical protein [Bacteroidota bacterium]